MIYIAFNKCDKAPASQKEAGVIARDRIFSLFNITDEVKRTENGKPYIENSDYCFSISHSETLAVCALRCKFENYDLPEDIFTIFEDGEGEVGIDVQISPNETDFDRLNKISQRYFNKEFSSAKDFIYHWTKTEALCKYKGAVLAEEFKADLSENSFFCGELEFDNEKYIMSVCY